MHAGTTTRTLRGLIEVTRLARAGGDLSERLEELAGTIGDSLGYGTVVTTLYRPAWHDFHVVAVSGREDARRLLLGCTRTVDEYGRLLDARFLRHGAYVIPSGAHDWSNSGRTTHPRSTPRSTARMRWHPEDVLLVPLKRPTARCSA